MLLPFSSPLLPDTFKHGLRVRFFVLTSCYVVICRFLSRITARRSSHLRMPGLLLPAFSYCFQPEPLSFRLVQCENLQFLFLSLPRFALSAGGSALLFYQCSNALPWSWPCRLLRGGSTGTTPGLGASSRYLSKNLHDSLDASS